MFLYVFGLLEKHHLGGGQEGTLSLGTTVGKVLYSVTIAWRHGYPMFKSHYVLMVTLQRGRRQCHLNPLALGGSIKTLLPVPFSLAISTLLSCTRKSWIFLRDEGSLH